MRAATQGAQTTEPLGVHRGWGARLGSPPPPLLLDPWGPRALRDHLLGLWTHPTLWKGLAWAQRETQTPQFRLGVAPTRLVPRRGGAKAKGSLSQPAPQACSHQ